MVATLARRADSLTEGGRWAAFVTGTLVFAAGWGWALLLVAYFVLSSALTRHGAERKRSRTEGVLPAQTARNATQVAANGGLFVLLVLAGELLASTALQVAALGALAAAMADTWATEIGTLYGGTPRSILTARPLLPGESGGMTVPGTLASVAAAFLVGATAPLVLPFEGMAATGATLVVSAAGVGGSLGDSLLGATLQSKRWCEQCRTWTERRVHTCQYRTQHARGVRWMTNDTVNFLATALGAALVPLLLLLSA